MKLNEIVVEGWADNLAALAQGATGYTPQDKAGRDSFTQKFTRDIYSKLVRGKRLGKMTGMDDILGARIPPGPTPTPPTPPGPTPPTPPGPTPPTPPGPTPPGPTPPGPTTYSIPIGLPGDTQYVKGPAGWVDARLKRFPPPAGIIGMLDQALAAATAPPVTEQYNKLNAVFEQLLQEAPRTRRGVRPNNNANPPPGQTAPLSPELYLSSLVGNDIGAPPTITDPKAKALYDKQLAEIRRLIPTAANAQNRGQLKLALDKIGALVYDITKATQKQKPAGAL